MTTEIAPPSAVERLLCARTLELATARARGSEPHFAAMEEPDLLIDDVRKFFRRFRDQDG